MTGSERALVVARGPGATEVVGGLPLAARAVLALRAAGIEEIAVLAGAERRRIEMSLARRGAVVRWVSEPGDLWADPGSAPVLVVPGDHLVDATGVGRAPGCAPARLPALVEDLAAGRALGEALRRAGTEPRPRSGDGLFLPLDHPLRRLEAALMDTLARHTAAGDSYMAAVVDRRLSRPITRRLLAWPWVSPSQVTLLSIALGLLGAAGLATTGYGTRLAAVLCLVASIVLDCVDGEIARARFEQSAAGARLDVVGDYLVNLSVFVGLGIGLARQGLPGSGLWAAVALVGGVGAAMLATHVFFVRPALARGGDLHWRGDAQSLRGAPVTRVIEKVASRDYTYLLLLLAVIGHLEWFLYAAAVGSWLFAGGLVLYRLAWRARQAIAPGGPPGAAAGPHRATSAPTGQDA